VTCGGGGREFVSAPPPIGKSGSIVGLRWNECPAVYGLGAVWFVDRRQTHDRLVAWPHPGTPLIPLVSNHVDEPNMTRRIVLLLLALAPMMIRPSVQAQARSMQPHYSHVTLCGVSFHNAKMNPKYISINAEVVSAIPHGLFLTDRRCARNVLQIDFADTGLNYLLRVYRATGTFRGVLKRDHVTGRPYLWLQSVKLQSGEPLPEIYIDEPIQLPDQPLPKWPPIP